MCSVGARVSGSGGSCLGVDLVVGTLVTRRAAALRSREVARGEVDGEVERGAGEVEARVKVRSRSNRLGVGSVTGATCSAWTPSVASERN